jgi:glutamate synthase (NADPH/NADH) large chain
LPDYGRVRYRRGDQAEAHAWQPSAVRALQRAVGSARGESVPRAGAWDEFTRLASGDAPSNLRDLLDFVAAGPALPLAAIEPADAIVRRFVVSAMSLGALSPEAHGTLTLAMNRLGARSNTGEGGEDPALYRRTERGERADSKVKQVASGRFGVTVEYLARADELEIKIAQGSKPGEGGQLPGHKVTDLIARLRHAQPGHALISPPPHHDIYSIEDLAQLIYDLKRCNPRAAVGVKLVSEAGVGTIAAGVAKAWAHYVVISGHDGGTGASPLSSIKHAGTPWEMGLAETQQVLLRHGMRGRIRVRVDGGLMNASDVLVAALLGAEEFGFGTAPLVALGCDMARRCHLNTCPTGIATQDPELRAKFRGRPEQVERFFRLLAEDLRRLLALLGLRSVADAVGRVDLLRQVRFDGGLDLSALLARVEGDALRCATTGSDRPGEQEPFEDGWVRDVLPELARGRTVRAERVVRNSDRTVGARISGEIARRWGGSGLPPGSVVLRCMGSAGQSFGAFGAPGLLLELTGEANDYVGKGLSGADLVLRPTGPAAREPHRHVILGNVALYGATSGRLFAAGCAGERFAVRNSGALAVVEGAGDHACEYMTGGVVVVLGPTGVNVGAGMTGGEAFVYDEDGALPSRLNTDSVACARPRADELGRLRALVVEHVERTGSANATRLLAAWESTVAQMWRVAPV